MPGLPLAVVFCPHPPALVPEVAPGTDDVLGEVRRACDEAVEVLVAHRPQRVVVMGPGELAGDHDESSGGTLAGWGADVRAGGPRLDLPLSLTIGAWLLDRAGWTGPRTYTTDRPQVDETVALLVMADGTATRTLAAPGFLDERSHAYDATISAALASGDAGTLTSLEPGLGAELGSTGVPTLMALGETMKGADVTARLRYDEAPLGVGYFVADWVLA